MIRILAAILLSLIVVTPAYAVTVMGTFSVAGAPGPTGSFAGSFQVTYDPSMEFVDDAVPDAFLLTIGTTTYDSSNTRIDTGIESDAPVMGGRSYLFGRFGANPIDDNNTVYANAPLPDFRLVFILDSNGVLVSARGVYKEVGPRYGFDTSMNDGSTATFVVSSVPELPTWTMVIFGVGMVGASMRQRSGRAMMLRMA